MKEEELEKQIKIRKKIEIEKEQKDVKFMSISSRLANNLDYFELFFEILDLDINEINCRTWNLLNQLPINKIISDKIKNLYSNKEKIEWSQILESKSLFKLIYSLQIINSILSCGFLDEKEIQNVKKDNEI